MNFNLFKNLHITKTKREENNPGISNVLYNMQLGRVTLIVNLPKAININYGRLWQPITTSHVRIIPSNIDIFGL